jgi:hypothetical protein
VGVVRLDLQGEPEESDGDEDTADHGLVQPAAKGG